MSTRYSVAEARDQLPRLIRRAEVGDGVFTGLRDRSPGREVEL